MVTCTEFQVPSPLAMDECGIEQPPVQTIIADTTVEAQASVTNTADNGEVSDSVVFFANNQQFGSEDITLPAGESTDVSATFTPQSLGIGPGSVEVRATFATFTASAPRARGGCRSCGGGRPMGGGLLANAVGALRARQPPTSLGTNLVLQSCSVPDFQPAPGAPLTVTFTIQNPTPFTVEYTLDVVLNRAGQDEQVYSNRFAGRVIEANDEVTFRAEVIPHDPGQYSVDVGTRNVTTRSSSAVRGATASESSSARPRRLAASRGTLG